MTAWGAAAARQIDYRDSDMGQLYPFWRCQYDGRVFPPDAPRSRQHRVARQLGGRKGSIYSSPVCGVTLCGSATTPGSCHLLAESRDETDDRYQQMVRRGFVIKANQAPVLLLVALLSTPLILWDGRTVWPTEDGQWSDAPLEMTA